MDLILDIEEIRTLLPHRYPLLLVDRILSMVPGKSIVGYKNVSINEPFFTGHFPGQAVMPGVLIIESMAQVAAILVLCLPEHAGKLVLLAGIEDARFRKPVVPGDTMITEATVMWIKGSFGKVSLSTRVDGQEVASCEMKFAFKAHTPPTHKATYDKIMKAFDEYANAQKQPGGEGDGATGA